MYQILHHIELHYYCVRSTEEEIVDLIVKVKEDQHANKRKMEKLTMRCTTTNVKENNEDLKLTWI